MGCKVLLINM